MSKIFTIQYLRAMAAIAVVCFHAAEKAGTHFIIGAAGVDVFFVISGFIMWTITVRKPSSPAQFLRARVERIVPLYWIATTVMVLGGLAGLFPSMTLTASHVLYSYLFIPHISPSNGMPWPVLVQGWTLNYEMFFYLMFAGALLLRGPLRLGVLIAVFCAFVVAGLVLAPQTALMRAFTSPIILEFVLGAVIGKLWLSGVLRSRPAGLLMVLTALCGLAYVGITLLGFNPFVLGPLAALLVAGALALENAGSIGQVRFLAYLGDSSFSVYLWHTIAISVVFKAGSALSLPPLILMVVAIVSGVVVGILSYEILESPIARALSRRKPADEGLGLPTLRQRLGAALRKPVSGG